MSQVSKSYQDLATIDVLRDIDYPSCAYIGTPFAYMHVRIRVPKLLSHGEFLYSAWASRCRFIGRAMREPHNVERQ